MDPRELPSARRPRVRIVIPERVAERAATRFVENEAGCFISAYDWMCCECRSGGGSSRTLNDAHRNAQIHMLAAHGGREARA